MILVTAQRDYADATGRLVLLQTDGMRRPISERDAGSAPKFSMCSWKATIARLATGRQPQLPTLKEDAKPDDRSMQRLADL
jgi:hypothetical protein